MKNQALFFTKKHKPVEVPQPLAPLADTHGHLTSFRRHDPAQAIARAEEAGVRLLVVPVDPSDDVQDVPEFLSWFEDTIEQAKAPDLAPNVYFVAGVHPYGAQKLMEDPRVLERLIALIEDPRCVGVGEFGLDFGPWNELAADVQELAFRRQLRIAQEHNLPVELHLRDGEQDTLAHDIALRILREDGVPAVGCDLHCFTSGPEVMAPFVDLGYHIAFGGALTFARSEAIRQAAAKCPQELLLSETDSPYMAPVPLRGQECEPAMVVFSAAHLAQVREESCGVAQSETYDALWHNANRFFGLTNGARG